jgi:hypothetical protein
MASRAAWQGPRGFSFESITTASGECGRRRAAAASMGSVITRNAAAADAAADRCRKERREKRGMEGPPAKKCIRKACAFVWSGNFCPLHTTQTYCPVPVTFIVSTLGFAESVSVIALALVPIACGVNVTVIVHFA